MKKGILAYAKGDAKWQEFFKTYNILPHLLTYESLCENKVKAVEDILEIIGFVYKSRISLADAIDQFDLPRQQYDAISEEWYRKFLKI